MLFYADHSRTVDLAETGEKVSGTLKAIAGRFRQCQFSPCRLALETHADLVGAAIALGEAHQALADQVNPTIDDASHDIDLLASAGLLLGRCLYRSVRLLRREGGDGADNLTELLEIAASAVRKAVDACGVGQLQARVPEGYAFYSLYPEMYLASLSRALAEEPKRDAYVVVGIRSIGTSLATIVAGALAENRLTPAIVTVRPRGHPFHRYIELSSKLKTRLQEAALAGSGIIVVDEGPGLTCSSFLSVCSALEQLGVEAERTILLSAWQGKPSIFASEEHRARWRQARVFHTPAEDAFDSWQALLPFVLHSAGCPTGDNGHSTQSRIEVDDLSYGRWRERCYSSPDRWPTVHRAQERTKLLIRLPAGEFPLPGGEGVVRLLAKFAGLGDYGREKLDRARWLAEAGFSPPVAGLAYGFLLHPFLDGFKPMSAGDLAPTTLARLVDYYAFIYRRFSRPPMDRFDSLVEILAVNAGQGLGLDLSHFVETWRPFKETVNRLPLVLLDGKPQPYEWLMGTVRGRPTLVKTDSSDHFRDHTLIKEQSILWDLAGACEEWEMGEDQIRLFLALWERETGDHLAVSLLDFYRAVYLAFRAAAMHYAVHSTDEEDIRRSLQHEQWKYNQRLEKLMAES